jgi:hypothetical protein
LEEENDEEMRAQDAEIALYLPVFVCAYIYPPL